MDLAKAHILSGQLHELVEDSSAALRDFERAEVFLVPARAKSPTDVPIRNELESALAGKARNLPPENGEGR